MTAKASKKSPKKSESDDRDLLGVKATNPGDLIAFGPETRPDYLSQVFLVDPHRLRADPLNPNVQDSETFDDLIDQIEKFGFDEPIRVIPDPENADGFLINSGEHRWKAALNLEMALVPVVVMNDWSLVDHKLNLMRRNNVRGETDAVKFTQLLNSLRPMYAADDTKIAKEMGFRNDRDLAALYIKEQEEKEVAASAEKTRQESRRSVQLVDSLNRVVGDLLKEYGDTLDQSFIAFCHGGRPHLLVEMSDDLISLIADLSKHMKASGADANEIFVKLVDDYLNSHQQ